MSRSPEREKGGGQNNVDVLFKAYLMVPCTLMQIQSGRTVPLILGLKSIVSQIFVTHTVLAVTCMQKMPLAVLECNLFLCHKKEVLKKEIYSYFPVVVGGEI
jgi:hypothetical protein